MLILNFWKGEKNLEKLGAMHALIRAAFPDFGINQSALARAVGVSPQRLNGYWRGERPWPADVALSVLAVSGRLRRVDHGLVIDGEVPSQLAEMLDASEARVARGRD